MELSPILRDKVCHRCIVVFYTNPPPTILPLASGSRPGDKKAKHKDGDGGIKEMRASSPLAAENCTK